MKTFKSVLKVKKHLWLIFAVVVCTLLVHSPADWLSNSTSSPALAQELEPPAKKVAVMPFFKGKRPEDIEEMLNCPLDRLGCNQNDLVTDAEKILTRMVQRAVEGRFVEMVIPLTDVITTYENMGANSPPKTPRLLAKKLGEALGADYIFLGNVWRYREPKDVALGSSNGASVAFNVFFLRVATGQKIWKGTFDRTQRSLTDNVLDVKGSVKPGLKWLSANNLAHQGVKEIFKKFPY